MLDKNSKVIVSATVHVVQQLLTLYGPGFEFVLSQIQPCMACVRHLTLSLGQSIAM